MFTLKIATLNVNGINDDRIQVKLVSYLRLNGIQIAAIQEHNIKIISKQFKLATSRNLMRR